MKQCSLGETEFGFRKSKKTRKTGFTVPPGTYHLWVGYGKATVEQEISVESGKMTQQTVLFPPKVGI